MTSNAPASLTMISSPCRDLTGGVRFRAGDAGAGSGGRARRRNQRSVPRRRSGPDGLSARPSAKHLLGRDDAVRNTASRARKEHTDAKETFRDQLAKHGTGQEVFDA